MKVLFYVIRYKLKLLEAYLILHLFRHNRKLTWLSMNVKFFWYSITLLIAGNKGWTTTHHIYLQRQRWTMELITAIGTKLYDFQSVYLAIRNLYSWRFDLTLNWSITNLKQIAIQ